MSIDSFCRPKFSEQFCDCVCETSKNTLMTFWLRCSCWKCKHGRPSFQFTVFFESKKMLSFAALGLSLDPVNNIWKSGKSGQKIKMYFCCYFNVLKILFVSCLFCICSMFGSYKPELAGWGNLLAQNAEDFSRFVKLCLTGCFSKWTINQKRPSSPPAAVSEHKKITYLSKS